MRRISKFMAPLNQELQPWARLGQLLDQAHLGIAEGSAVSQRAR